MPVHIIHCACKAFETHDRYDPIQSSSMRRYSLNVLTFAQVATQLADIVRIYTEKSQELVPLLTTLRRSLSRLDEQLVSHLQNEDTVARSIYDDVTRRIEELNDSTTCIAVTGSC